MKRIKFLGAAGMVTGSSYQLTSTSGQDILIDLGMFQGVAEETAWNFYPLQFKASNLIGAILTHAHLDHGGRLPLLVSHGFKGQIYMTEPTFELIRLSLYDAARIAKSNPERMLYTEEEVDDTLRLMRTIHYHQEFSVGDFRIFYRDAGHLLGSASIEIVDTSATGPYKKIVFSGDLGNTPQYIIRPTEKVPDSDIVVMESTYGDKTHPDESPLEVLASEINTVEETGGTLLIPTFALERSQDILILIGRLVKEGRVNFDTPFFLDSPMAIRATEIYRHYPELFNAETVEQFKQEDPFLFPGLEVVEDFKLSTRIKRVRGPKVIIAGSGMMTGGRILAHAREFLPRKTTRLLLVGYQGEETLGREILEGATKVKIDKRSVKIHATISETESLSSHADQPRLLNWLGSINGVKKVFLTHGEEGPRGVLSEKIKSDLNLPDVYLPKMNEEVGL